MTINNNKKQQVKEQSAPDTQLSMDTIAQAAHINSVLFVDSAVENNQSIIKGVQAGTQVVILEANQDGVQQIANTLSQYSNLDSIQILSHGSQGQVNLGNNALNQSTLDTMKTIDGWKLSI